MYSLLSLLLLLDTDLKHETQQYSEADMDGCDFSVIQHVTKLTFQLKINWSSRHSLRVARRFGAKGKGGITAGDYSQVCGEP